MADEKSIKTENPTETENKEFTYATLMETSGEHCESWYYFIRYQGNESVLKDLNEQLNQVNRWYVIEDLSTFDLELDYLVCEKTAKEMTKIDMNHNSFHRKFDGRMKKINLGFKHRDSDKKKMKKAFKLLGEGGIEDFVDKEDVDEEDLVNDSKESESEDTETETETESESESEKEESDEEEKEKSKNGHRKMAKLPKALDKPRLAQARQHRHKHRK